MLPLSGRHMCVALVQLVRSDCSLTCGKSLKRLKIHQKINCHIYTVQQLPSPEGSPRHGVTWESVMIFLWSLNSFSRSMCPPNPFCSCTGHAEVFGRRRLAVLSAQHRFFDVTTRAGEAKKDFWDRRRMLWLLCPTYCTE